LLTVLFRVDLEEFQTFLLLQQALSLLYLQQLEFRVQKIHLRFDCHDCLMGRISHETVARVGRELVGAVNDDSKQFERLKAISVEVFVEFEEVSVVESDSKAVAI
jgi:hypothetical protein